MKDFANSHSHAYSSGYGKVFLVRHKDTGGDKLYAMKMFLGRGWCADIVGLETEQATYPATQHKGS